MVRRKIRDIMTRDPLTAHPENAIRKVAGQMLSGQIHRLPVTDAETGKLVGIITSLDLVAAIAAHELGTHS